MSSKAFEPITLRELTVRNRVWVPPMCQYSAMGGDGVPTDWHLMHYGSIASGGAGAIIVEATAVVPEGRISPRCLGLWSDRHIAPFARITSLVKGEGAAVGIQLAHAGRKGSAYAEWSPKEQEAGRKGSILVDQGGWQTVAPSAIAFEDYMPPRELTVPEIDQLVEAFTSAAGRAVRAGFDFIEIHAAHGYLLHEFLSPLSNKRTDEYGGSLENRARFMMRVVRSVREVIPEGMPLLVRLSGTDWDERGISGADTVKFARMLKDAGVDMVDVSTGGLTIVPIEVGPGYQVPWATQVKYQADIPVATVGMITHHTQVEQIISTNLADVVLIGREVQRNPYFPVQAAIALGAQNPPVPPQAARAFRQAAPRPPKI